MFWKFNHTSSPHIETLLSKDDVTLRELMDEDDILQECKVQNKKLIDFLVRQDVLDELVELIIVEPPNDVDENTRYKYANIACELLTCDVPSVNERVAGDDLLLHKLYSFLESDKPLNPLLASFFSKTLGVLVSRKADQNWYSYQFTCLQVLEFLESKKNFVPLIIKNLGTSSIMDLILKLITHVEGYEMSKNILNWLDGQEFVPKVVSLFDPSVDSDRHCNASQLLCDIIKMIRENQICSDRLYPDPIITLIESPETVTQLLNCMLNKKEKSETSIVGGIAVLLCLLECGKQSDAMPKGCLERNNPYGNAGHGDDSSSSECDNPLKVIQDTISAILPRLKDLHDLLVEPPSKPAVKTTAGVLDPPLGNTRLQVAKLFAALIATCSMSVNNEIAKLGTVDVLLDLFFKYTWNNFLHCQVEQCLVFAINTELSMMNDDDGYECLLLKHIFLNCKILQRILEAWDDNESQQLKIQGRRRGYMGHLIKIANNIENISKKGALNDFIKEHVEADTVEAWETFVANALTETNKTHMMCLGGINPVHLTPECEDPDYRNIPYSQDGNTHQFQYVAAQQFFENHTFREEEFAEADEEFHMSDEDPDQQAEMFKQVCAGKLDKSLDGNDEEDEDEAWNDQDLAYRRVAESRKRDRPADQENTNRNSSDEEDERTGPDRSEEVQMEVDNSDAWSTMAVNNDSTVAPVLGAVDPWSSTEESSPQSTTPKDVGWAKFETFFESNFTEADVSEETDVSALKEDSEENSQIPVDRVSPECDDEASIERADIISELHPENENNTSLTMKHSNECGDGLIEGSSESDDNANPKMENADEDRTDNYRYLTLKSEESESSNVVDCGVPLSVQPHPETLPQENGPVAPDENLDNTVCSKHIPAETPECEVMAPNGPV